MLNGFLPFALAKPALMVVPLCGLVASLAVLRIKRRYIKEGSLFRTRMGNRETSRRNGNASDDSRHD